MIYLRLSKRKFKISETFEHYHKQLVDIKYEFRSSIVGGNKVVLTGLRRADIWVSVAGDSYELAGGDNVQGFP